jgi:nucleotide-binding universal stress UspA family protein
MSRTAAARHEAVRAESPPVSRPRRRWLPWRRAASGPDPQCFAGRSLLLASEGRAISRPAVELAARLAKQAGAEVHVLSIARVWGTSLGLPHPALMPNKRELKEQQDRVAAALALLKRRGISASGQVLGTRNAAKRIVIEAERRRADAIVMAADAPRHWLIADMIWSQEPYRVRRHAAMPVYLVVATDS